MGSFAAAVGIALMMLAACDKKEEETESDETEEESAEEPKEEASAAPEESASASATATTPPPVTTTKPPPVRAGACTAQGQCNGGLCCSDGAKTFCAEKGKPCGGGRVVCTRDGQCGKNACLAEASLPGIKTCQKKPAATTKPVPKPPSGGDIAPFGRRTPTIK